MQDLKLGTEAKISVRERAMIYFYRPKLFANSKTKVIIGTVDPDEVVLKLKNGRWYKTDYSHLGMRSFVAGVFKLNPEVYDIEIKANQTYFFRCQPLTKGLNILATMEQVEEAEALKGMEDLKEQIDSYTK